MHTCVYAAVLRGVVEALGFYLWYSLVISVVPLTSYAWSGVWPSDLVRADSLKIPTLNRILLERGMRSVIEARSGLELEKEDLADLVEQSGT